jgi:Ca2+-binding EF-hand superfamily protein
MATTVADLREALKNAMLETMAAQRVIDKARRTPNAAKLGKCIDVEYLHSNLSETGVTAPRLVVDELFSLLDPDGDGVVDYNAFLKVICGNRARDFLKSMERLVSSDSVHETNLRKVARRERLAHAAATEIKDPFELLRSKLEMGGDNTDNFRKAFRKFKCRSSSHLSEDAIDFRGFKQALLSLGLELSEAQFRRVFNTIDKDGGRTIDFNEFSNALCGDQVSKSGVKDWVKEVADIRRRQKDAYEAAAAIIRSPSGLYITLRNMARVAWAARSFLFHAAPSGNFSLCFFVFFGVAR